MRIPSLAIISCCLGQVALAQDAPPVIRLVCYEVFKQGEEDTHLPGFVAIAQQLDGNSADAELYVPGTLKYEEAYFIDQTPFFLKVYYSASRKLVPGTSSESIDKLLLQPADFSPTSVTGTKAVSNLVVAWGGATHAYSQMSFEHSDQSHNSYTNNNTQSVSDSRFVYCDTPYLVTPEK